MATPDTHLPDPSTSRPVALITGAGSGIGQAAAVLLAHAGYHLALVARKAKSLDAAAARCRQAAPGCQVLVLPGDISLPEIPPQLIQAVERKWARLDVLLNIAGSAPLMPIKDITPEHWQQCMNTNLSGPILLTAAAWPLFKQQGSGFVGNVSSMSSIDPFPGFAMYAAAKIGLNMFTHCTAQEGEAIHVRAVAVAPGAVETPMLRQNFSDEVIGRDRTLSPEQVAQVLCDCLLGKRAFTSGETIVLPSPG